MALRRDRTCRVEIVEAIRTLRARTGDVVFAPMDIIREMERVGTTYPESTIRTHVTSRMCANAPKNHPHKTDELERVGPGLYRLIDP